MSSDNLPNVVGRMDDVVAAIRSGDAARAAELLRVECERREAKVNALEQELATETERSVQVEEVFCIVDDIARFGPEEIDSECLDVWIQYRIDCGWRPE